MINITIDVANITETLLIYSKVELKRYNISGTPPTEVIIDDYIDIIGEDLINSRSSVSDVLLSSTYNQYYYVDPLGDSDSWYIIRYSDDIGDTFSAWSSPLQGETGNFFYNPVYPSEVVYTPADKKVIDRIRLYIGDPIGLNRQFGQEAEASIHNDGRVFELDEYGWPCSINMYGTQYNSSINPSVNGYRYLRFKNAIDTTVTTVSGIEYAVDVWYYTFRNSDNKIMDTYNNCFPPSPLNQNNCTAEIYMLQTSYDILSSETWEAITEDGTVISDDKDTYNPTPGLSSRDKMLSKLRKRLDDAIKSVRLLGIGGVRLD